MKPLKFALAARIVSMIGLVATLALLLAHDGPWAWAFVWFAFMPTYEGPAS